MKPFYEKIQFLVNKSFFLCEGNGDSLTMPFHYHPELELCYHSHYSGTKFIGTCVEQMETEELTFLGANLPHAFMSDKKIKETPNKNKPTNLVLQSIQNLKYTQKTVTRETYHITCTQ